MATTMKTSTVSIPLFGHGLESAGNLAHEPVVTGNFAADIATGNDGIEYAVFTVAEGNYPSEWVGVYRISVSRLKAGLRCIPDGPEDPETYNPDIFA